MTTHMTTIPAFTGYFVHIADSDVPLAWFITSEDAYDWKAKHQGPATPLLVTSCSTLRRSLENNSSSTGKVGDSVESSPKPSVSGSTPEGASLTSPYPSEATLAKSSDSQAQSMPTPK